MRLVPKVVLHSNSSFKTFKNFFLLYFFFFLNFNSKLLFVLTCYILLYNTRFDVAEKLIFFTNKKMKAFFFVFKFFLNLTILLLI